MSDRVLIPLADGRFLALTVEAFREALAIGTALMGEGRASEPARGDLVDARECAKALKVPVSLIYRLAREERIPSVRVGAKYRRFCISRVQEAIATAGAAVGR